MSHRTTPTAAGERLTRRFASVEKGMTIQVYWTTRCSGCAFKAQCTTGKERRIRRWEHEAVLETMEERLRHKPEAMQHLIDGRDRQTRRPRPLPDG